MAQEKMLTQEEAEGLFDVAKRYLLEGQGDLSPAERKGLGRLLSEIQYSLESGEGEERPPPAIRRVR